MATVNPPKPSRSIDSRTISAPVAVEKPPCIVLGGEENALSIARSLSKHGVKVYALNKPSVALRYSRFAKWIRTNTTNSSENEWVSFLLGDESNHLRGAVVLAANDIALQIVANHREALTEKFQLDLCNPTAQLAMLDKLRTYQCAQAAGIPTPRFWTASSEAEVASLRDELVFPLLVKPLISHVFNERFGRKFLVAKSYDELLHSLNMLRGVDIDMMLVEQIPGDDDQLCSYYTYIDEDGNHLFQFTKRIIRRYPVGMGRACHHITDHVQGVREPAMKLWREAGLQGLANVEFKWDERDNQFKLIECNARFTAANVLLQRCGYDLARFVYNRIVGLPTEEFGEFPDGVRLWYPIDDFRSCQSLRKHGKITFFEWTRSFLKRNKVAPFFEWTDPGPGVASLCMRLSRSLRRRKASP